MNISFDDFVAQQHMKMVRHFVKFCNATDSPPTLANCNHIFGICDRDSKPIVADTIQILAGAA